jgi:uncharacterized membrane protein YecN with MAPEG domain
LKKEIVFLNGLPPIFKYKSNVITYFQNANILNFTNGFDKIISSNLLRSLKFFFFKKNVNKWVVFSNYAEDELKKHINKKLIYKEKIHIKIEKREREKKIYDFIYPANGASHKNHKNLEQAIRAQANFIEYVPFGLILLSCLEINKIHPLIVFILGGLLFVGRFLHAKSFTIPGTDKVKRVQGMQCTFWSMRLMAAMLIFSLLVSFMRNMDVILKVTKCY